MADTIDLPGEPPIGKDGVSPEYLRQLNATLAQMKAVAQSLESQINVGRKTT